MGVEQRAISTEQADETTEFRKWLAEIHPCLRFVGNAAKQATKTTITDKRRKSGSDGHLGVCHSWFVRGR
ncbi:hypothetical protein ACFYSW_28630 [Rhodococcus aetherivorans]|uniref:hypothetical protein n=1 Tax=Rhodococcus aetherivorans TaxID=191292 RepID=UPI0036A87FFA